MKKTVKHIIISNTKEIYNELVYKVSWPLKQELSNSTIVVMITSLIIALMIFAIDFSFENAIAFIYKIFV